MKNFALVRLSTEFKDFHTKLFFATFINDKGFKIL